MATKTTHLVNLDALIAREDFETDADVASLGNDPLFKVEELKKGRMYFSVLRKPEFQRETASWSPEMILDLIESFLDGKLIPSIIIWHSKQTGKVFVIDGAHRVSALIAWVNDDYGDGEISRSFYGHGNIPKAQRDFHNATKQLIEKHVGSYLSLVDICLNPESTTDPVKQRRANFISTSSPHIQKVDGSAAVAEESFFKINGNPATIDQTELDVIRARKMPNAIATRALIRAGTGYKYAERFPQHGKDIQDTAKYVHELVFGPFSDIGSKSPDVPRAGQPYSGEAFRMVLDMVNLFNNVLPTTWQHSARKSLKAPPPYLPDDSDGSVTLQYLEKIKKVGLLVHSNEYSGSLGLDQAVYSYGSTGKVHPTAFLASLKFAVELSDGDLLHKFTAVRNPFEEFLVSHKSLINEILGEKGSRKRSLEPMMVLHRTLFAALRNGVSSDEGIIAKLSEQPQLKFLKQPTPKEDGIAPKKFSKAVQAAAIVQEVLAGRARCPFCNARLPPYARSKDHKIPEREGGRGDIGNLQFTHPFCQSGYKERLAAEAKRRAAAT